MAQSVVNNRVKQANGGTEISSLRLHHSTRARDLAHPSFLPHLSNLINFLRSPVIPFLLPRISASFMISSRVPKHSKLGPAKSHLHLTLRVPPNKYQTHPFLHPSNFPHKTTSNAFDITYTIFPPVTHQPLAFPFPLLACCCLPHPFHLQPFARLGAVEKLLLLCSDLRRTNRYLARRRVSRETARFASCSFCRPTCKRCWAGLRLALRRCFYNTPRHEC